MQKRPARCLGDLEKLPQWHRGYDPEIDGEKKGKTMKITKVDLNENNFFASEQERKILGNLLKRIEKLEGKTNEVRTPLRRKTGVGTWRIMDGEVLITNENTIADVLRHLVEECNGDKTEVESILEDL